MAEIACSLPSTLATWYRRRHAVRAPGVAPTAAVPPKRRRLPRC
jgi:hypothetical protein